MEKNLLVEYESFKKDIADDINKYIDVVPAIFISEFLDKLVIQFNEIAKVQMSESIKESEEKKDANS
jgi:hypothetical protein